MAWIVRILFVLAAPIAALLVGVVQTMIAIILMTGFVGLAAALRTPPA